MICSIEIIFYAQKIISRYVERQRHFAQHVVARFGFSFQPFAHLTLLDVDCFCKRVLSNFSIPEIL